MKHFRQLNDNHDFLIDVQAEGCKTDVDFLLLNPLEQRATFFKAEGYDLEHALESAEGAKALRTFEAIEPRKTLVRDNSVTVPEDFACLSIIPNHRCNFHCSYCYSAGFRNRELLSLQDIKTCIRFILKNISERQQDEKIFYCEFGGGGEPFLEWDLIKETILFAENLATSLGIKTEYSFTSNGSLINAEQAQFLAHFNVHAVVSFEILREVQQEQRGHFEQALRGIRALLDEAIRTTLIATITPANVNRQTEMIQTLATLLPDIRRLSFEPVVSTELFHQNAEELKEFFMDYAEQFIQAEKEALNLGITLRSTIRNKTLYLRKRSCVGGFNLTADGITFCPMVSNRNDHRFQDFAFGKINGNELRFDTQKLRDWPPQPPARFDCESCYAKWNCGGMCPVAWREYTPDMQDQYCFFIRYFVLYALLTNHERTQHETL